MFDLSCGSITGHPKGHHARVLPNMLFILSSTLNPSWWALYDRFDHEREDVHSDTQIRYNAYLKLPTKA